MRGCLLVIAFAATGCNDRPPAAPAAPTAADVSATPSADVRAGDVRAADSKRTATPEDPPPTESLAAAVPASRPAGPPPLPDDETLMTAGLTVLKTDAVRLITDLPAVDAAPLLPVADAAYATLPSVFGEVPTAAASNDSPPVTAMIVRAEERLRAAGLIAGSLQTDIHGRHDGWRFWMRWPQRDYYRRHLMMHEMAHCWTMAAGGRAPDAFLEGCAEWFATHRLDDAELTVGVLPTSAAAFRGWGRIETLRREAAASAMSAREVMEMPSAAFTGLPRAYAWAWAWCVLADRSPQTADDFASLRRALTRGDLVRDDVYALADRMDATGLWAWWQAACDYGVDPRQVAPRPAMLDGGGWTITAQGGWQETTVQIPDDGRVLLEATGLSVLGHGGRPWTSAPRGIRLDYFGGVPIGTLLACVRRGPQWSEARVVGEAAELTFERGGVLCLRVNDAWAEVGDNAGGYTVVVTPQ